MTGIGNINGVSAIIFPPSEYLTHCLSENDENDNVHEIYTILNSGRFHQDNYNILANYRNIINSGKTTELI